MSTTPTINGKTFAQASSGITDTTQLGALAKTYQATTVPSNVIPAGNLGTNGTTPLIIPNTTPTISDAAINGSTASNTTMSAADALQQSEQAKADKSQTDLTTQMNALMGVNTDIGNVNASVDRTAENAARLQADQFTNQIEAEQRSNQKAVEALQQSSGGTTGGVQSAVNALNRASLSKQADLALLQNAANRNYTSMDAVANEQVKNNLSALQAKSDNLKMFIDQNQTNLTTAENHLFNLQQQKVDAELQAKTTAENAISNIKLEVAKSGSPNVVSIMDALSKIDTSKPGALDQALKAAGSSLATSNNDFVKLDNGNTVLVDKNTGKIIKYLGGSGTSSPTIPSTPIIRTVTTPNGKNAPVDSYTLSKGDDPYFIAQRNGLDMQGLKDLNTNIKDWNNLPIGAVINVPSKNMGSGAITAVAGIPLINFNYLTQGTSALTRMNQADRERIMAESDAWLKKNNIDYSTFQSRYKAYNKVVEDNVARANNTTVFGGEVSGTVDQFVSDVGTDFSKLRAVNLADLWAGKQVNNPTAQKYAFDLITMRNDLAGYYAASRGKGEADDADKRSAELVIQSGMNAGSATAFKQSINSNEQKVTGVVNKGVDTANKQVWDLFGVGDQYKPMAQTQDPMQNIQNYGNAHPDQQATLTQMKLDHVSVEDINNWVKQQTQ